jgi:rare lipoprotein A
LTRIALAAQRTALAIAVATLLAFTGISAQAQTGIASVYSTREGSSRTASGIPLRDGALTAAHKSLPFGTHVRVTNLRNGRSVVVTISDRGPYVAGRVIDLTPAGARAIAMDGLARVRVEVI